MVRTISSESNNESMSKQGPKARRRGLEDLTVSRKISIQIESRLAEFQ